MEGIVGSLRHWSRKSAYPYKFMCVRKRRKNAPEPHQYVIISVKRTAYSAAVNFARPAAPARDRTKARFELILIASWSASKILSDRPTSRFFGPKRIGVKFVQSTTFQHDPAVGYDDVICPFSGSWFWWDYWNKCNVFRRVFRRWIHFSQNWSDPTLRSRAIRDLALYVT